MHFHNIKKVANKLNEIFLSFGCKVRSPHLCALSWKINLLLINFKNKSNSKKKILVLYKSFGSIDLEELKNNKNNEYNFLYLSRRSIKIIFSSFFSKLNHELTDDVYFSKNIKVNKAKKNYNVFLKKTLEIFNKKNNFLAIISYNFRYRHEKELHSACKPLNIKFIVCQKESLHYGDDSEITKLYIKTNSKNGKYEGDYIFVYTEGFKKVLISASICEQKKIIVTGMPRADYYYGNLELSKKHILYLLPSWRPPPSLERVFLLDQKYYADHITKIILDFAENNPNEKIIIKTKMKKNHLIPLDDLINTKKLKNVSILKGGNIGSLIKDSKAVIGFQSSALIESLILKKPIIVPYFDINNSEKFKKCTLNLEECSYYAYDENSMKRYLNDICSNKIGFPVIDDEKRKNIINHYIGNIDGKSSNYLLNALNKILN